MVEVSIYRGQLSRPKNMHLGLNAQVDGPRSKEQFRIHDLQGGAHKNQHEEDDDEAGNDLDHSRCVFVGILSGFSEGQRVPSFFRKGSMSVDELTERWYK